MPRETKIVDRNKLNGQRVPWASGVDIMKETTVKRGGVIRKKIVSTDVQDVLYGKPNIEKSVTVSKYGRSGDLKKTKVLSNMNGNISKTVTRPGGEGKAKRVGLIGKKRVSL